MRLRQVRRDLAVYVFSGSEDPVGQQLKAAGIHSITHDFYAGGRHEMLNDIIRDEVRAIYRGERLRIEKKS